jgi:DNA-binding response OmpR family regulator
MKRIRAQDPTIAVILITGHGSAEDGAEGLRAGAFDYVMKPIQIGELLRKLEAAGQVARRSRG